MAQFSPLFGRELGTILQGNPDIVSKPPSEQLEMLLVEPWMKVVSTEEMHSFSSVIIIDALDECENIESVLNALIPAIQNQRMPGLKFLFTSRPENHIYRHLNAPRPLPAESQVEKMYLHNIEESLVQADIAMYLSYKLQDLNIAQLEMDKLIKSSGKLFIYAATLVKYICDPDFPDLASSKVQEMTSMGSSPDKIQTQDLDELYSTILKKAIPERLTLGQRKNYLGAQIGDPFQGHDDDVNSVAFSADGTKIVSGSSDLTIRLWETATGAQIVDPLQGHDHYVNSVVFSADGTRIVSGSSDKTIRLWDTALGAQIGDSLQGHDGWVRSVAFSADGTKIISGSDDRTIRLWDTATGGQIGEPLQGHDDHVNSVAFSADGTRIVSG
ncbi:WD40 repeat-like protein, partial [Dendrothele bispora CBS 962.96]